MSNRLGWEAFRQQPPRRAAVELGDEVRLRRLELVLEKLGEEVVVAVPLPLRIEREEEEVRAGDRVEHRRRQRAPRDGIAQRRGESLQNGRAAEEQAHVLGLGSKDLLAQVVDDAAVVAGERLDVLARVIASAKRERGQVEARSPALRSLSKSRHGSLVDSEMVKAVDECVGLFGREGECTGVDLDELTLGAQSRECKRGLVPRRDHELDGARQVLEEELEPVMDLGMGDEVVVVEDEHDVAGRGLELVGEHRQQHPCHVEARSLCQDA